MKTLIITHPGSAHFDEFLAISLILATNPDLDVTIERREPAGHELDNPDIWVIDIGEQLDHACKNFDHHQSIDLQASFVLVSDYLGLTDTLRTLPWWSFKDKIDRFGPSKTGAEIGTSCLRITYSPFEEWYLDFFASKPNDCISLMRQFGISVIGNARKLASQFKFWEKARRVTIKNKTVVIGHTSDTAGSQEYNDSIDSPAAAMVTHDSRGKGWKLCRFDSFPEVDFSRLEGHPAIKFTHKTGFVAKTIDRFPLDEVLELVEKALPDDI